MLVIRFFRVGKLNQAFFKIVVTEKKHGSRSGRFVEEVGFYNPATKEKNIKTDRIKYWLGTGAQASDTVHNLLVSEKIIQGDKRKINIAKSKKEKPAETPVEIKPEESKKQVESEKKVEESQEKESGKQPKDNSNLTSA